MSIQHVNSCLKLIKKYENKKNEILIIGSEGSIGSALQKKKKN